ncbi:uncharacterized protein K452DRAFT_230802 [Aplosporella prunicola CBS 121167]|uniref:Uncharacterized protein n=1 Tax=Aplosporella prunicola CBS 121167 TaxID=1176127 RepID=A0A6A6B7Q8_9PEZI|nr:uncharacterized protein K452DRAFT_230802 [Aplosporella prunicola CBS 121167]KAF2140169.1 hypothetical protein K452DRAFT_230802 [Aplosporella prunicola CBS 121167]
MSPAQGSLFNALVRTHHITSRKKVANLKKAADNYDVYALLRSGGCPGIMYCSGNEDGVREWVAAVHRLRYKDFQLAARPALAEPQNAAAQTAPSKKTKEPRGLHEVDTVKEFGAIMEQRGVLSWWRKGMGYEKPDD